MLCCSCPRATFESSSDVKENPKRWKEVYDSVTPHESSYPGKWNALRGLDRMVVLRCLRPDKIVPAVQVSKFRIP